MENKVIKNSEEFDNISCYKLDISNKKLYILPHINYNNLIKLNCAYNFLESIDELPPSLIYLDCSHNILQHLPTLPCNLETLNCNYNSLVDLNISENLKILNCSNNKIITINIPDHNNIKHINCSYNKLITFTKLKKIKTLDIKYNNLKKLYLISPLLKHLDCSNNDLNYLSIKSKIIKNLNCSYNSLKKLPSLQYIEKIICNNNNIKKIKLGRYIVYLDCGYNGLTTLPILPNSIDYLNVYNNPFNCFLHSIINIPKISDINNIIKNHHININKYKQLALDIINYNITVCRTNKTIPVIDSIICDMLSGIHMHNHMNQLIFFKKLINYMS